MAGGATLPLQDVTVVGLEQAVAVLFPARQVAGGLDDGGQRHRKWTHVIPAFRGSSRHAATTGIDAR